MEIIINNNSISVKDVNLGKGFNDITGDLLIDEYCRVTVTYNAGRIFVTDIANISPRIFSEMNEIINFEQFLKDSGDTKISKLFRKMIDITQNRVIDET